MLKEIKDTIMPSSSKEGKTQIREWITEFAEEVNTVIDLGAGNGTYHKFYAEKSDLLRKSKWIAVEAWEPYIERFELTKKYDSIICKNMCDIDYTELETLDLAFLGDVLEHVTKEQAVSVIDKLSKVCKRIIISIPIIHYPQGEEEGNPFEAHVKDDWSHDEVIETFPNIVKSWQGKVIGVYLIEI
jgi:hypothetical protein